MCRIYNSSLILGLILYNGEARGGGGDFVSIGLRNGIPEFRFDMGSGPAVIRGTPVSMGQWHTIQVSRQKKNGKVRSIIQPITYFRNLLVMSVYIILQASCSQN